MSERFIDMLAVGGTSNSLGRAHEVIQAVIKDPSRLHELYECLLSDNAWVRMRAADSLEKICRVHPEWLQPYVDVFLKEFSDNTQPSIQWHLAEIYAETDLNEDQRAAVAAWLKRLLSSPDIDWIVAANAMQTVVDFAKADWLSLQEATPLLKTQLSHKSPAVVRRATKFLNELTSKLGGQTRS